MVTRPRTITELPATTTLANTDLFIVEVMGAGNTSVTSKMTAVNLRKLVVQGPFANDSAANTGGVVVGQIYYTAAGDAKVRIA